MHDANLLAEGRHYTPSWVSAVPRGQKSPAKLVRYDNMTEATDYPLEHALGLLMV